MVVDRKKHKALALLYMASGPLRNAANSSIVPTELAAEPQQRWSPWRQIRNLNFLTFVVFAKTPSPCDFAPKTRDTEQGYLNYMPPHIGDPVMRTDGWTDGHVAITSLPKFLGLTGYQICLAEVLRWRATRVGSSTTLVNESFPLKTNWLKAITTRNIKSECYQRSNIWWQQVKNQFRSYSYVR